MIVAIDGPAGSGKSTVSKRVACKLGITYLDTGAMYRAITYGAREAGVSFDDVPAIVAFATKAHVDVAVLKNGMQKVTINGEDVTEVIRDPEVTRLVKHVAKIPEVRAHLVSLQRACGESRSIVAEGRDTTTVVFTNAYVKVFLDGNQEERARRRFIELQEKGMSVTFEEILQDQIERDRSDVEREVGALKKASDAFVVDTTGMSIDDVVNAIVAEVKRRQRENHNPLYWVFRWPYKMLFNFWNGITVTGAEHIPDDETGFLLPSNHLSFLDPPLLGVATGNRQLSYLAKDTLFKNPLLGPFLSKINVYPIDRNRADRAALSAGIRMIQEKKGLVIFPESTRSEDGKVHDARKNGAGFIALKTGCQVIPAYVCNTHAAMKKHSLFVRKVPVSVHFGAPIDFSDIDLRDKNRYEIATRRIMNAIRALEAEYKV